MSFIFWGLIIRPFDKSNNVIIHSKGNDNQSLRAPQCTVTKRHALEAVMRENHIRTLADLQLARKAN